MKLLLLVLVLLPLGAAATDLPDDLVCGQDTRVYMKRWHGVERNADAKRFTPYRMFTCHDQSGRKWLLCRGSKEEYPYLCRRQDFSDAR